MKRIWVCLLLLAFFNTSCAAMQYGLPGQLTLQVIEENGEPVENAEVVGYFGASYHGITDIQGMYIIKGTSMDLHFAVTKIGYYKTNGIYDFSIRGSYDESRKQGRWLPWNPTYKVVLRRKINPAGMYWKDVGSQHGIIPTGQPIGYDLVKGDWVNPYGNGETADFIFDVQGEFVNYYNQKSSVIITFSNKDDGMSVLDNSQENKGYLGKSEFSFPYTAPETGYENNWHYEHSVVPAVLPDGKPYGKRFETELSSNKTIFFRIRTQVDQNGNIVSALYGRLAGEISGMWRNDKSIINFRYFLNPDGSRNMENDPKKDIEIK